MQFFLNILFYFFILMWVIFTLLIVGVAFLAFADYKKYQKYLEFKKKNIGKFLFVYWEYKKEFIESNIIDFLPNDISSFDMTAKDKLFGYKNNIAGNLYAESRHNSHNNKSPYLIQILESQKKRAKWQKIKVVSLREYFEKKKDKEDILNLISITCSKK